ncbi:MAG TPA: TetR/AcrR family transcriptional regulator [Bacteroidetes bacterium]|nr:TetR/AcrR family transcriptional regulator [Bacteroidota bacterium]
MPKTKQFDEQQILEKAMELFWKKGLHATSIQDLVNHLGISRSSIYDTFGGKKELFDKSFQLYRTANIAGIKSFLKKQENVKTGLRKLFEMGINESISDKEKKGCFVVNTTTELIPGDQEIQAILKKNKATFENIFYKFLLSGEQSGEIPKGKDLKTMAGLIFTFYNGIKVVAKVQPNRKKLLASVDTFLTLLD